MSKLLAIILSFFILFQSFSLDINDFNKLPELVDHIASHLKEGDSLTEFITLHYGSKINTHEQEHNEHKELPFKHQHLESHFQMVFILCVYNYPLSFNEIKVKTHNFNYKEPTTTSFINSFFQPPQKLHS